MQLGWKAGKSDNVAHFRFAPGAARRHRHRIRRRRDRADRPELHPPGTALGGPADPAGSLEESVIIEEAIDNTGNETVIYAQRVSTTPAPAPEPAPVRCRWPGRRPAAGTLEPAPRRLPSPRTRRGARPPAPQPKTRSRKARPRFPGGKTSCRGALLQRPGLSSGYCDSATGGRRDPTDALRRGRRCPARTSATPAVAARTTPSGPARRRRSR